MSAVFARLLKQYRHQRCLTQEQLAERAGISARSLRELERGRSPRPHTVDQLATGLDLRDDDCTEFVDAGRAASWVRRTGPDDVEPGPRINQLPPDLPDFVGRDAELAALEKSLLVPGLVAVSGPPGVGKTALTVHAAHRLSAHFPDGILFAALRAGSGGNAGNAGDGAEPADVLADLLRAIGIDGAALPAGVDARASLFRARLANRRILLVLDDAAGHRQVEPLLPGAAAVLASSRTPLTALPGVTTIDLELLPEPDALTLLGRVAGETRVAAESAAAAALVAACGGLPLAVRIAAARLAARPRWTVSGLAARFSDERRRLDELRHADLSVRSGLEIANGGLSPAAARAFAMIGALGLWTVAEWTLTLVLDSNRPEANAVLDELVDARLLDDLGPDAVGQARYGLHDLTRLYARERASAIAPETRSATLTRVAAGCLALLRQAQDRLECERFHLDDRSLLPDLGEAAPAAVPAVERPQAWFAAERATVSTLVTACADAGLTAYARAIAGCVADFYELGAYYDDWHRVARTALSACRSAGDRFGAAAMLRGLGACLVELDDPELAIATLRQARALAVEVGDSAGAAMVGKDLGFMLSLTGRLDEAERVAGVAVEELARAQRFPGRAMALGTLGMVRRQRGEHAAAVGAYRTAVSAARDCGDRFSLAYTLRGLSGALVAGGQPAAGERAARRAAGLFGELGDQIGRAQSLRAVGEAIACDPVRTAAAERVLAAAAAIFDRCGHRWGTALSELSIGELAVRRGDPGAAVGLRRSLRYWLAERVPALQARALAALAAAAELDGDPDATGLFRAAHRLYHDLGAPEADALAARLGPALHGPVPDVATLVG